MFTVVLSTKNEERNLPRCLQCLSGAPEIIVIDSGSTDRTAEIARAHGARVVDFRWDGRFPKKRNWALRQVEMQHPWVLFLDADEFLPPGYLDEVRRVLADTAHMGFWLNYDNHFMGRRLRHGERNRKLALFRRDAGEYERIEDENWSRLDMEVHEHPILRGTTGEIATPIEHNDYKGLHAYIARHNDYSTWEARRLSALRSGGTAAWEALTPRQRRKYASLERWWLPVAYFGHVYLWKRGVLDGWPGFCFAAHKAIYFFQIRLKLRELAAQR